MPSVYGRLTKLHDASGRSEYITDEKRQEEIVLHEEHMTYDWSFYGEYEQAHSQEGQKNNEALLLSQMSFTRIRQSSRRYVMISPRS